jgi:hypothetical protein
MTAAIPDKEKAMTNHAKRLLLSLDRLTQSGQLDEASLHLLAPCAGISDLGVAMRLMKILEARGYATVKHSTIPEQNYLQITPSGIEEAMRLKLPFWKRWMADQALMRQMAAAVIGGIIVAAGNTLVRWLIP